MTIRRQRVQVTRWSFAMRLSSAALAAATLGTVVAPIKAMAQEYRFQNIQVEGNTHIESGTVLNYARLAKGTAMSGGDLNDALQRLQGSGLFQSVDFTPKGSTLVIHVTEYPMVGVVAFEGNKMMKDDALTKLVKTQSNHVYSPAAVEADANLIAQGYAQNGRPNVRIDPKVIKRADNRIDVVFEIHEGAVSEIERISFTGNTSYSDRTLRDALDMKQAGIFHNLVQRDNFAPEKLEGDRQQLVDFYHSRGYPDVQVTGVSTEMSRARDGFFITYNIQEGQQYHFGSVTTVSEVPELKAADYAPQQKIPTGTVYSPRAIELAVTRMEELALRRGLNFIKVTPVITRNAATQTLNVQFTIQRAARVFIERIDVQGNTTTQDQVIRRQFRAVEGDPFNPREIQDAQDRIKALGFFKTVDVTTKPGDSRDQVIVDVHVEEQPTGTLTLGASYGASSGFGITAAMQEDNFLGRGQSFGVSIGTTSNQQQSSIDFMEPYFLGRNLKARIHAWYNTTDNSNAEYSTRVQGISPSLEFPVTENSRLELRYTYGINKIFGVTDYDAAAGTGSSPELSYEQSLKDRSSSALGYTFNYDTTKTGLDPRYGYQFKFGQDYSGLGGDVSAVKSTALIGTQRKIMHESVTLRAELEGGAVHPSGGDDLTVLDRFSGYGKIRGFEPNGIGPRDVGAPNRDALGGNYFWALRLESEFPIGLPEEYGITGGVFWDTGSVWGLGGSASERVLNLDNSDSMHIRSAVGFSIFWKSVLGPLRLNFSKALKKETYDKEQNFDLTISTKF